MADSNDISSKLQDLSIHNRGMNPNAQAKLLAFQAKRQQQQSNDEIFSPIGVSSPILSTPSTPRNEDLTANGGSFLDSDDQKAAPSSEGLMRRTSFRLPKKKSESEERSPVESRSRAHSFKVSNDAVDRPFGGHATKSADSITAKEKPLPKTPDSVLADELDTILRAESQTAKQANGATAIHRKTSLSQRRGMKLDFGSLGEPTNPAAGNNSLNKLKQNMLPQRGAPSIPSASKSAASGARAKPNLNLPQAQPKPSGMFANYAKYVDIKSGSLNFAGKASVHSKGIDFSNGSSFRISYDDIEFLEELGRGNYGIVSKVLHKPTGIIMAMKEVRLELDDSKFRQILMELEVLHSCASDCIVDFYGAFFVEGAVYMCIEYMQGGSLDKIYGSGLNEPELAYATKCVVKGLKQLKDEHNIIHRDVKPTNILVGENGKVKLCDFGVSGNLVASLARTNIGCQSYMAPERIKSLTPDDATYSVQSDIWSLGLSILEIAKGSYPYPQETYDNIFSQLSAIVDGEPPTLPDDRFSKEARDFVSLCLNKNPNKRPGYAELLPHPWLNKYDDAECQKLMAQVVALAQEKKQNGSDPSSEKTQSQQVPPLHKIQLQR
ncbi:hypothetical protein OGAPHI_002732 [Ogataea philodendri]|uniref:mitogen-activated protein kinase kinase n=1 Tax=Ogataea philodendri TaxID=1378263 RepID=A0A9P8PBS7_9ASCO|nr:uncharacterized protein OGAPHI_002732 [Ogataea philodendri]KAH3668977.1 hypothetical protein OGAPHI_002732 [Ogataea philodendri]